MQVTGGRSVLRTPSGTLSPVAGARIRNYYATIVHADFAQWTDFDAIWSARRVGTVLPTPVTDLCAEAVHRSGNVELSLLNSRPKRITNFVDC